MGYSCQCGDDCPACSECDEPKCECYCNFEGDGGKEFDEESDDDSNEEDDY